MWGNVRDQLTGKGGFLGVCVGMEPFSLNADNDLGEEGWAGYAGARGTKTGHIPQPTMESGATKLASADDGANSGGGGAAADDQGCCRGWAWWVWQQLYAQVRVVLPVTLFLLVFE